jgi:hypothetical protein
MTRLWIASLLVAAACSSSGNTSDDTDVAADTDVAGSGTGRLLLRFTIDPDLADAMAEPPVGHVWGDLYNADDIDNLGPKKDDRGNELPSVLSYEAATVDITPDGTTQTSSEVLFTTEPLPVGYYRAAGFLDSDGNGADTTSPEEGDPVTFPANNEFEVLEDQDVEATIEFNLLYPKGR